METVVRRAKVGYATFYKHFADKEAAFLALLDAAIERTVVRVEEAYRPRRGSLAGPDRRGAGGPLRGRRRPPGRRSCGPGRGADRGPRGGGEARGCAEAAGAAAATRPRAEPAPGRAAREPRGDPRRRRRLGARPAADRWRSGQAAGPPAGDPRVRPPPLRRRGRGGAGGRRGRRRDLRLARARALRRARPPARRSPRLQPRAGRSPPARAADRRPRRRGRREGLRRGHPCRRHAGGQGLPPCLLRQLREQGAVLPRRLRGRRRPLRELVAEAVAPLPDWPRPSDRSHPRRTRLPRLRAGPRPPLPGRVARRRSGGRRPFQRGGARGWSPCCGSAAPSARASGLSPTRPRTPRSAPWSRSRTVRPRPAKPRSSMTSSPTASTSSSRPTWAPARPHASPRPPRSASVPAHPFRERL